MNYFLEKLNLNTIAARAEYVKYQPESMINIHTQKICGKRGIYAKGGMIHYLNYKNNFQEKLVGRSSCARLCYSRMKSFEFNKNNAKFEMLSNCSKNSCWKQFPCYHWSYNPIENTCILHTENDPENIINEYEKRFEEAGGKVNFIDYLTTNGEMGCLSLHDIHNPYVMLNRKIYDVPNVCTYLHIGESNLTERTKSQCYNDYLYRELYQKKEEELLEQIKSELLETESRSKRIAPILMKTAVTLPAIFQWFTNIMKSEGNTEMISPTTSKTLFNSYTLDKMEMLKALMSAMQNYAPKLVNKQMSTLVPLPNLNIMKNVTETFKSKQKNIYKNIMKEEVQENLQWKSRRNMILKSLKAMKKKILLAKTKSSPLTKTVAATLKQDPFVFGRRCIKGGKVIQRLFFMPETVESYPNNQYIAISLNQSNAVNQGPVISGHNRNTNMQELSCMTAISVNEKLPKACFLKENASQAKYSEYILYTKGYSSSLIIKVLANQTTLQILCPEEAVDIYAFGLVVAIISKHCSVKLEGKNLRIGEKAQNNQFLVKGFFVIYNGKFDMTESKYTKQVNKFKKGIQKLNEKIAYFEKNNKSLLISTQIFEQIENLKHQTQFGKYWDYVIIAILSAITVLATLQKIYNSICKKNQIETELEQPANV